MLHIFDAVERMRASGAHVVLTASAVELSITGNRDMLIDQAAVVRNPNAPKLDWSGTQVAVDKREKLPRLYGMTELVLDSKAALRDVYGVATRNTQGTLMNDSSSRSHCFAILTLRTRDPSTDTGRRAAFSSSTSPAQSGSRMRMARPGWIGRKARQRQSTGW